MLELANVTKSYASSAGPLQVLNGISLRIEPGQSVSIAGPSGCGKSTLLNLIGALDKPDSGTIQIAGQNLAELDERAMAAFRSRKIGFVFQLHHLLPQCTVLENVLLPTLAGGRAKESPVSLQQRAMQILERVGLADRAGELPGRLSGGQRQRAAVARALINRPELLLADEPTGSLDEDTAESVIGLLMDLNRRQKITLIVVTHSASLARRMDRPFELRHGKLVERLA
jgi:lipoprotein-releasing system ATP-binding protein